MLRRALKHGGQLIIATFAPDGPQQCSDLHVARYSAEALAEMLGDGFALLETFREAHTTPWQTQQQFLWCRFLFTGQPCR